MIRGFFVALLLFLIAIGLVPIVEPALAAYACPSCFGLERIDATTYMEDAATASQRQQAVASIDTARARVSSFFGGLESRPRLLVCVTEPCDRRLRAFSMKVDTGFMSENASNPRVRPLSNGKPDSTFPESGSGGGARATSYGHWFVRVSPRGLNEVILTHELFHTELRSRLGYRRPIPAWLNEGLAVVVSRDERYLHVDGDRRPTCRVEPGEELPERAKEWRRSAGRGERPIYAMAACRALRWLEDNGEQEGFAGVLEAVADGERPLP